MSLVNKQQKNFYEMDMLNLSVDLSSNILGQHIGFHAPNAINFSNI